MNAKNLSRYYDTLSARERFPLLLAAQQCGDEAELERPKQSAARQSHSVSDYHGLAVCFMELSWIHLVRPLSSAALMFNADRMLDFHCRHGKKGEDYFRHKVRLTLAMRMQASLFMMEKQVWQEFCAELHLDPYVLRRELLEFATVEMAEETARVFAFGEQEANETAKLLCENAAEITVAKIVANYREILGEKRYLN